LAICTLAASCAACASQSDVPPAKTTTKEANSSKAAAGKAAGNPFDLERELRSELDNLRKLRFVGMDEGPVPDFELRTSSGVELDSAKLVGHEPFVVFFFATWCELCERKLESVQRALEQVGPMRMIPVSVDGPETWPAVAGYLKAVGVREPVVRGTEHPSFTLAYNPFATVPLLVIVGRNGGLVDYQLGLESEHEGRLVSSLRLAKTIGPLAKPSAELPPTDDAQ